MSYELYLKDPEDGKTIYLNKLGESCEARINITYNYAFIFDYVLEGGIRSIYGKTGAESIPILEEAINKLDDDQDPDYLKPTEGNAKKALEGLLFLAYYAPHGIWEERS